MSAFTLPDLDATAALVMPLACEMLDELGTEACGKPAVAEMLTSCWMGHDESFPVCRECVEDSSEDGVLGCFIGGVPEHDGFVVAVVPL